jgi:hypothetical protein
VDALIAQTKAVEAVIAALSLGNVAFEGSDSLDAQIRSLCEDPTEAGLARVRGGFGTALGFNSLDGD